MTWLRRRSVIVTVLTGLAWPAGPAWSEGNVENGRSLAIDHCSRCHAVPGHNPHGGIGSTPSFKVLTYISDYVDRMQTFFDRRPHRAFVRLIGIAQDDPDPVYATPIRLKVEDVDDLVAYIRDLKSN
jgi:mono/diheme cytochrome c family protein